MLVSNLEDLCIEKFFNLLFQLLESDIQLYYVYIQNVTIPERASQKFLKQILLTKNHRNLLKYFAPILSSISNISLDSSIISDYEFLQQFNLSSFSSRSTSCEIENFLKMFNDFTKSKVNYLKLRKISIKPHPFVLLPQLTNLKFLDLSKTSLTSLHLKQICNSLHSLVGLNISQTAVFDLSPLSIIENRLEFLDIHMLDSRAYDNCLSTLKNQTKLRYLDLSHNYPEKIEIGIDSDILSCCFLKSIRLLDFSGNQNNIKTKTLLGMLKKASQLKYFIYNPDSSSYQIQNSPDWKKFIKENPQITFIGAFTKITILNCLIYSLKHKHYLTVALHLLFDRTKSVPFFNETLNSTIISHMRAIKPNKHEWLIAVTAVVYNLTKGSYAEKWEIAQLSEIVRLLIIYLDTPDINQQLVVNIFLVICNDYIIQNAIYDKLKLSQLIFKGMQLYDIENINQAGVIIISVIASELTKCELRQLVNDDMNFQILLRLICRRCVLQSDLECVDSRSYLAKIRPRLRESGEPIFDFILKFTLSSLWNLTDECTAACKKFVEQQGLLVYFIMIDKFKSSPTTINTHIYNKCLGLLNNIAEEEECRSALLQEEYLNFLNKMLIQDDIQMTYFAGGILSNLLLISNREWKEKCELDKSFYENCIYAAVESWVTPNVLMASYRSFSPFENLIRRGESSRAILLWALWAIRHTMKIERKRYAAILKRHPDLIASIQALSVNSGPLFGRIRTLASDILALHEDDHSDTDLSFEMMME